MKKEAIIKEWSRFSDMDLETALILNQQYPKKSEVICYHCQQAAEKILKAFLLQQDEKITKTHDLEKLRQLCENYEKDFSAVQDTCLDLNDFGVLPRYPFELEILPEDAENAISDALKLRNFIAEKLGISHFSVDDGEVDEDTKEAIFEMLESGISLKSIRKATKLTPKQFNKVLLEYDER